MSTEKKELIWTPDPLEGYVLGHIVDVGADTLTVELEDQPGKVGLAIGWSWKTLLSSPSMQRLTTTTFIQPREKNQHQ